MNALGSHLLIDLWEVQTNLLDDVRRLRKELVRCAWTGGATVVDTRFSHFEPHGISGLVILSESHLAIHTWPEKGFAAVDVFTCGEPELAQRIVDEVVLTLAPGRHELHKVERGSSLAAVVRRIDAK